MKSETAMDDYCILHIPTGKIFRESFVKSMGERSRFFSVGEKLALLNSWNRQGGNDWKYWHE